MMALAFMSGVVVGLYMGIWFMLDHDDGGDYGDSFDA